MSTATPDPDPLSDLIRVPSVDRVWVHRPFLPRCEMRMVVTGHHLLLSPRKTGKVGEMKVGLSLGSRHCLINY